MDIVGGVQLVDGSEAKIVSGIDDHSRFVICARVVARATARPVCDALEAAMAAHGVPEAVLTDNGKVFTARFGPGPGPVRFDRICTDNGIDHLLTAPRSPTTTGKVERWHKTLRREFLDGKVFASIEDAQAQLDAWVVALQPRAATPGDRAGAAHRTVPARRAETRARRGRRAGAEPWHRAGDDPAGQRQGHDQLRRRAVQGRAPGWPARGRGGLRRRARAAPPPGRAHRHPRSPARASTSRTPGCSVAAGCRQHPRR